MSKDLGRRPRPRIPNTAFQQSLGPPHCWGFVTLYQSPGTAALSAVVAVDWLCIER